VAHHHGSESYFVEGEGLLGEAVGGRDVRPIATAASGDGADAPPFRFSRMGPKGQGKQHAEAIHKKLALAMTRGGGGPGSMPGGYTYLGQFVDHDLTFDKTTVALGDSIPPSELEQARSPSLDLDSLYGAGPGDAESAKFYSDGVHLKVGSTDALGGGDLIAREGYDLPRGTTGSNANKRKANIPDHRNDENLAVAQTHLAMIRFHNKVVDKLPNAMPATEKFGKARDSVTKHYQWMLRNDYLPRIVAPAIVNDVFNNGRKVFEKNAPATKVPTMPIEFSVAAFRLGHSMIRDSYDWNAEFPGTAGTLTFLFIFSGTSGDMFGGPKLPANWTVDWRRMYDFKKDLNRDDLKPPAKVNKAMRIDTRLANTLSNLPKGSTGDADGTPAIFADLAFRNFERGKMVKLATGQQMAQFMRGKGVNVKTLTKAQLRDGNGGAELDNLTQAQRDAVLKNTPLWFYVLREAELNGGKLTGVGGRIVAETFHRAIQGSAASIIRDPAFKPSLGPDNKTFRMTDLLMVAFESKKNLLAPLGDKGGGQPG